MLLRIAHSAAGLCALAIHLSAAAAIPCGPFNPGPVLKPIGFSPFATSQSDAAVDCYMWQTFINLNWPAASGQRGLPNAGASFGSSGPTVWETFKSVDEVFLPGGQRPGAWNDLSAHKAKLLLRGQQAPPGLRVLSNKTKFFRPLTAAESAALKDTVQAGGGVLYDQGGQPVYYEILMNQASFEYIMGNGLYDADQQYHFAANQGLALPTGAIEVKAAWKVLSASELAANPVRFHTAQAVLPDSQTPVTVGLVGMHIFQMPSAAFNQGFWATFAQADNAPLAGSSPTRSSYSFNRPDCPAATCPPNAKTARAGTPTQLVQIFGVDPEAKLVNDYVQNTLQPAGPWKFYNLINVQWPRSAQAIGTPGAQIPLPIGTPSVTTLMNPVLESFNQKPSVSCIGCHRSAQVAQPGNISAPKPLAASYSFLLGHANPSQSSPAK